MDWIAVIDAFVPLIKECLEERAEKRIRKAIQNPGIREWKAIRRFHRGEGLRGKPLRDAVRETIQRCRECTDDEINDYLEEVKSNA